MSVNPLSLRIQAFGRYYVDQARDTGICLADIKAVREDLHKVFWSTISRAEDAYKKDDAYWVDAYLASAKKAYLKGMAEVRKARQHGRGGR